MRVRIDKTRKDDAAAEVQLFGTTGSSRAFDAPPGADGDDSIVVDDQPTIANNSQVGKRSTAPRHRTAQRQKLGAAGDQPVRHGRALRY
jgi:hypothetical protein